MAVSVSALPAAAQTPQADAAQTKTGVFGMTRGQVVAVAAGAVAGAVVVHAVLPGDFTYLIGSVAGGLLADWWYNNGGSETIRASINYMPPNFDSPPAARILQARLAH